MDQHLLYKISSTGLAWPVQSLAWRGQAGMAARSPLSPSGAPGAAPWTSSAPPPLQWCAATRSYVTRSYVTQVLRDQTQRDKNNTRAMRGVFAFLKRIAGLTINCAKTQQLISYVALGNCVSFFQFCRIYFLSYSFAAGSHNKDWLHTTRDLGILERRHWAAILWTIKCIYICH